MNDNRKKSPVPNLKLHLTCQSGCNLKIIFLELECQAWLFGIFFRLLTLVLRTLSFLLTICYRRLLCHFCHQPMDGFLFSFTSALFTFLRLLSIFTKITEELTSASPHTTRVDEAWRLQPPRCGSLRDFRTFYCQRAIQNWYWKLRLWLDEMGFKFSITIRLAYFKKELKPTFLIVLFNSKVS